MRLNGTTLRGSSSRRWGSSRRANRSIGLLLLVTAALTLATLAPLPAAGQNVSIGPGGGTPGTSLSFELVGHDPLLGRGMNSALAVYGDYVYVGSRTDGSTRCGRTDPRREQAGIDSCPHPNPGVLIVDASDPSDPDVVGRIGPPEQGLPGQTSRELRVWPEKKLLIVMNFQCGDQLHACAGAATPRLRFYDLSNPRNPEPVGSYQAFTREGTLRVPHEMYLWVDPRDPDRALVWLSLPSGSRNPNGVNLQIVDISGVPKGGQAYSIAEGTWNHLYAPTSTLELHSMWPSYSGTRTHLAYTAGFYLMLDTTAVVKRDRPPGQVLSLNDSLITPVENRPTWEGARPGHSAVPFLGRPFVFVTDEVYGTYFVSTYGCPWGWGRVLNVGNPRKPKVKSEYKVYENTRAFCESPSNTFETNHVNTYTAHNPTLTRDLALVTWSSAGVQAVDIRDPGRPRQAGWFSPTPLAAVANEDPATTAGPNKVMMWSFPIISDGLIYVTDIRNGLYILRYQGEHRKQVADIDFLEGNSNLGDMGRLDGHGRSGR
jgi:hypothetical protein